MKIYLARHGQTTTDIDDQYGGAFEDHLTELGREQVNSLADKLRGKGIQAIFASPNIRTQESAAIVAEKLQLPVATIEDIRERDRYGILTGMVKSEACAKYPELVELLSNWKSSITSGEDYSNYCERARRGIEAIVREPYETVFLAINGGFLRFMLWEVLGQEYCEIVTDDCALLEVDYNGSEWKIASTIGITRK